MPADKFIPFNVPAIGEEEIDEVVATLRSGWLTTGPRTAQFEQEFRRYVEAPHALAVNSWTSGAHLALAALNLGPGAEVITTPLTFCATVNTIMHAGATPVLADILPDGNIDPESVASRITPRTRAIAPVHLAGLPCRMDEIWSLARRHGLYVIEDAAHAVGTHYRGRPIGACGPECKDARSDAVVFSFYATKNLTTGEGGMIVTHDERLLERMRILCLHGISKDAWNRYAEQGSWFYEVVDCGFKYNMSDIQAAIGIHQLRKQERFLERRVEIVRQYNHAFADVPELEIPPDSAEARHCWHLYMLRLRLGDVGIDRAAFIGALKQRGIGSSVHFIPIPMHPAYGALAALPQNQCPRALELYQRIVSLPLYPGLTDGDVRRVVDAVLAIVTEARRSTPIPVARPR